MSIRSTQINTLQTSTASKPCRWGKQQDSVQPKLARQVDRVQAIRKLEQVYFLERRGLL